jgi:hypothetical protein
VVCQCIRQGRVLSVQVWANFGSGRGVDFGAAPLLAAGRQRPATDSHGMWRVLGAMSCSPLSCCAGHSCRQSRCTLQGHCPSGRASCTWPAVRETGQRCECGAVLRVLLTLAALERIVDSTKACCKRVSSEQGRRLAVEQTYHDGEELSGMGESCGGGL